MTFEENLKQLQQVTKQLEQSTLPLEEALALYQKGVQLSDCLLYTSPSPRDRG